VARSPTPSRSPRQGERPSERLEEVPMAARTRMAGPLPASHPFVRPATSIPFLRPARHAPASDSGAGPSRRHLTECFGPLLAAVQDRSADDLPHLISRLRGAIAGTVRATAADHDAANPAVDQLAETVGRVVWDGYPYWRRGNLGYALRRSLPCCHRSALHVGSCRGDTPLVTPDQLSERARSATTRRTTGRKCDGAATV
jgi:hypothetical protein